MPDAPAYASSAVLSGATKLVLLALVSVHVLPWTQEQVAAVALAVSGVVDACLYFGLIHLPATRRARVASITPEPATPPGVPNPTGAQS